MTILLIMKNVNKIKPELAEIFVIVCSGFLKSLDRDEIMKEHDEGIISNDKE